jgi:hypothetical protein
MTVWGFNIVNILVITKEAMKEIRAKTERLGLLSISSGCILVTLS